MQFAVEGVGERFGGDACECVHDEEVEPPLAMGQIDFGKEFVKRMRKFGLRYAGCDAYYCQPGAGDVSIIDSQMLPDGILAGPDRGGELAIDDDDGRTRIGVGIVKITAREQGEPDATKVIRGRDSP